MGDKNKKILHKQIKEYRKRLVKIAKETYPWDYGWSFDFLIEHLKMMRDYYSIPENVCQLEEGCKRCYDISDKMIKEYESYKYLSEDERKAIAEELGVDYDKIEDNAEIKKVATEPFDTYRLVYKYYPQEINYKYFQTIRDREEEHYDNFIDMMRDDFLSLWD